jgi:hypothetical protein
MIICAHCHHQNPKDVTHCEACFSELSPESSCPSCGHNQLTRARFCGHCGYLLEDQIFTKIEDIVTKIPALNIPEPAPPEPLIELKNFRPFSSIVSVPTPTLGSGHGPREHGRSQAIRTLPSPRVKPREKSLNAVLIHQGTQFRVQLNQYQFPIYLGKPNRKRMPDIDLSTFKNSAIVSRMHANIHFKDNTFFIRDSGSANGTYVNHIRIQPGHIQCLEGGDKISFGQGDLVTFIFELS